MSLGLPSSVKYIDRSRRPKRVFIKKEDGTLEDIFCIYFVHPRQDAASKRAMHWDQDSD